MPPTQSEYETALLSMERASTRLDVAAAHLRIANAMKVGTPAQVAEAAAAQQTARKEQELASQAYVAARECFVEIQSAYLAHQHTARAQALSYAAELASRARNLFGHRG